MDRTFKSLGRNDDLPPTYFRIHRTGPTSVIQFYTYQHWNGSVGVGEFGSYYQVSTSQTHFRIYCNKHYVYIPSNNFNSHSVVIFLLNPPDRLVRTVQHSITGGTSVSLTLNSTSGIRLNDYKNIYGMSGEGQQEIRVTSINRATNTIIVTGCTNNYASGVLVGDYLMPAITLYSGNLNNNFPYNKIGTTQIQAFVQSYGDHGHVGGTYVHDNYINIVPTIIIDNYRFYGFVDETYFYVSRTGVYNDIIMIDESDDPVTNSLVTSFTSYTITDTTKNWDVDSLIGKVVVFISGTGSGYTRQIVGNTADTITFRTILQTIDTTTGYRIVDEAWRVYSQVSGLYAIKEEF